MQLTRNRTRTNPAPALAWPRLIGLALLIVANAGVVLVLSRLTALGYLPLSAAIAVILLFVNFVLLRRAAYPLRWMVAGLVLMALFTIYPIIFTVWVAFTNYGEGHLITKQQAIDQILDLTYLPETGRAFAWKTSTGCPAPSCERTSSS